MCTKHGSILTEIVKSKTADLLFFIQSINIDEIGSFVV